MSIVDQQQENDVRDRERGSGPTGQFRPRVERRRPAWAAAALVWSTLGIYPIVWFGINWSEIRRERNGEGMHAGLHTLAVLIPIYGLFRIYANFRGINDLLSQTRSSHRVQPLGAVFTFVLGAVVGGLPATDITHGFLLIVAGLAALSWVVYHGQWGMNAYWDARIERRTTSALMLWERLLLGFGGGLWFLMIMGFMIEVTTN